MLKRNRKKRLLHSALNHFGDGKSCNIVGIFACAEPCIKAEFLCKLVGDACAAAADDEPVAQAFRFKQLDKLGKVLNVYILLGNGLGNKKNIGVDFNRLFDEFLVGNLCIPC